MNVRPHSPAWHLHQAELCLEESKHRFGAGEIASYAAHAHWALIHAQIAGTAATMWTADSDVELDYRPVFSVDECDPRNGCSNCGRPLDADVSDTCGACRSAQADLEDADEDRAAAKAAVLSDRDEDGHRMPHLYADGDGECRCICDRCGGISDCICPECQSPWHDHSARDGAS